MKKRTSKTKLTLHKETIASLNGLEMAAIQGGNVCPPSSLCLTPTLTTVTQKITGQTCG